MVINNDKVLESMARDFYPKNSIAYNACIEGAEAIRKVKEKGVDDTTSLTEKRMFTIGFAHRVEEGLLDYLEKLEEFNS